MLSSYCTICVMITLADPLIYTMDTYITWYTLGIGCLEVYLINMLMILLYLIILWGWDLTKMGSPIAKCYPLVNVNKKLWKINILYG